MIDAGFEILNQRGTPMFFSDTFANRPAAGIVGRIFISTDTNEIYRDTGTGWNLISGTSTFTGSIGTGQVAFGTATNVIGGSNNLFWDNSNSRLGINFNLPTSTLDVRNSGINIVSLKGGSGVNQGSALFVTEANTSSTLIAIGDSSAMVLGTPDLLPAIYTGQKDLAFFIAGNFEAARFFAATKNFGINTGATDTGQKFQVVGTTLLNGNVTFGSTTGMFWDNTNGRLSIGNIATTVGLNVTNGVNLYTSGATPNNHYLELISNSSTDGYVNFRRGGGANGPTAYYLSGGFARFVWNASTGIASIGTNGNYPLTFITQNTERGRVTELGNLHLGTFTADGGQRLQVTGEAIITSATTPQLRIDYPSGGSLRISATSVANSFTLLDSQGYGFHHTSTFSGINARQTNVRIWTQSVDTLIFSLGGQDTNPTVARTRTHIEPVLSPTTAFAPTSGTAIDYNFRTTGNSNFVPTSGTATYTQVQFSPTINQTGGANGITRGIYVNPFLTAAADWRSIEWSNNSGWGLYGFGTALNYLNGNLLIGSTTNTGERLQITGTQINTDTTTYSTGSSQSFRVVKNLTIGSGATISSGNSILSMISTGTSSFGGSVSIPNSTPFATCYLANIYSITAAATTITSTQATGLRSVSQLNLQNYFAGTNSGTMTHVSSMQISGYYNNNTGTITPTITNAYQLLINNIDDYGHTFTFTNRWGIYQEGTSDRNYLAGNLMLGTTTDTGQKIQINGTIRIDGQLSATAGGSSGQHLIVNCDGTTYKIKLENV